MSPRGPSPKAGGRGAFKAPMERRDRGAVPRSAPPPARARFGIAVLASRRRCPPGCKCPKHSRSKRKS